MSVVGALKIRAEQLLLTLIAPPAGPPELHHLTHIERSSTGLYSTKHRMCGSDRKFAAPNAVMAQMHPPAAQKQRVNVAGISPNPAGKTLL